MKKPFVTKQQLDEITAQYPTPFHIYDERGIRENARRLRKAFSWNPGYREFFAERSRKSGKGIEDYPTYKTVCASPKELHQQNSYFIAEMETLSDDWEKL